VDAAYAQLLATSEGVYVSMSKSYTVKEEGYAYMYVSNEDQRLVDVYFDDVAMTYTPSNVVQYNEYYPFGLQTQNSWTRTNTTNNFLYDAGSELNNASQLYDLPFRNYDAALGRFHQIDLLAHVDHATSPFAYAGNNPVRFGDPTGLLKATQAELFRFIQDAWYGNGGTWSEDGGQTFFGSEAEGDAWFKEYEESDIAKNPAKIRLLYGRPEEVGKRLNLGSQQMETIFERAIIGYEYEEEPGEEALLKGGKEENVDDLIRRYEENDRNGWAMIFTGYALLENGVGGNYLKSVRKNISLITNPDKKKDVERANFILDISTQFLKALVHAVNPDPKAIKRTSPYLSGAGALLVLQGTALHLENEYSLAPKIKEANPDYYRANIGPINRSDSGQFGGGGNTADY